MKIYIDLDETLIHAQIAYKGNPGKRKVVEITSIEKNKTIPQDTYHTMLRPLAHKMLEDLRSLGDLRMLTTATRDYALKHNEVFGFNFQDDHIIAREDFTAEITVAYGKDTVILKTNTDPQAWLIDNLAPNEQWAKMKMKFLGMKPEQYIQIREFNGKDPEKFPLEFQEIKQKFLSHHTQASPNSPNPPNPIKKDLEKNLEEKKPATTLNPSF